MAEFLVDYVIAATNVVAVDIVVIPLDLGFPFIVGIGIVTRILSFAPLFLLVVLTIPQNLLLIKSDWFR